MIDPVTKQVISPCPFNPTHDQVEVMLNDCDEAFCICTECHAQGPKLVLRDQANHWIRTEAILSWNRRTK